MKAQLDGTQGFVMKRFMFPRFGWNWLDVENWCDGLMDDQGNFIPEYRLFGDISAWVLLYLTEQSPYDDNIH